MTQAKRLKDYICSLERPQPPVLRAIEQEAKASFVPIIQKETASLLRTMVCLKNPGNILEIGTGTGYSALLMAFAMGADAHITTIEKYEKRIPIAAGNFKRAGMQERITLIAGEAGDQLRRLPENTYDLIFMDAAKGQYLFWLPEMLRLLTDGGVLLSDNVLQDGDIIQSRYAVERRNRTIHKRMREYLLALKHHPRLETAILAIGDGVAVSTKKISGKGNEQ